MLFMPFAVVRDEFVIRREQPQKGWSTKQLLRQTVYISQYEFVVCVLYICCMECIFWSHLERTQDSILQHELTNFQIPIVKQRKCLCCSYRKLFGYTHLYTTCIPYFKSNGMNFTTSFHMHIEASLVFQNDNNGFWWNDDDVSYIRFDISIELHFCIITEKWQNAMNAWIAVEYLMLLTDVRLTCLGACACTLWCLYYFVFSFLFFKTRGEDGGTEKT